MTSVQIIVAGIALTLFIASFLVNVFFSYHLYKELDCKTDLIDRLITYIWDKHPEWPPLGTESIHKCSLFRDYKGVDNA